MTQTYGWFCPECNVRYRASACTDNKCPNGHSLDNAYWVYLKTYGNSFEISIKGTGLQIHKFPVFKDHFHRHIRLKKWIAEQVQEQPEFRPIFENLMGYSYQYAVNLKNSK